jgi:hypothetical protein
VTATQLFLPLGTQAWYPARDGDPRARALYERHYSCRHYRDGRTTPFVVGPGEYLLFLTQDCTALWVWRKFVVPEAQARAPGICCSVFRNEGPLVSSTLIVEACTLAWQRWPGERLYTYVNPRKIRSTNPGACFKYAGWRQCGMTKWNKLLIFECLPH